MSALGQKPTYAPQKVMSALLPIATAKRIFALRHVRFTPESGHVRCNWGCLLWAKSEQTHLANRSDRLKNENDLIIGPHQQICGDDQRT
jgi:hypothetical protein